jgi:hypothetical protein
MAEATAPKALAEEKSEKSPAKGSRRGKWKKRLLIAAASMPVLILAMWLAVHNIPGFGPLVADTLRAIFGKRFVAWLEDTAYGVQDWFNRKTRTNQAPEAAWEVPTSVEPKAGPAPSSSSAPVEPPFTLANVGPMFAELGTKGEGVWVPLADPRRPEDRTRMLKTFLHPDKNRSWAFAAVVAVDLAHVELKPMAGKSDPENRTAEAKSYERKAVVPTEEHDALLAAFNGSYKAEHGYYGMKVDGVTLTPARPKACTVARYKDGRYAIRPWESVSNTEADMAWFRQAPMCMFDEGKPNPLLDSNLGWGAAAVSGTTVIRRSAIGLDASGKILFVGIGDFLTGKTIATAMHHAGAHYVSQLDVNFSFPKFLTYEHKEPGSKELKAIPLTKKFEFAEDQYVGGRSERDFFYLVRR